MRAFLFGNNMFPALTFKYFYVSLFHAEIKSFLIRREPNIDLIFTG